MNARMNLIALVCLATLLVTEANLEKKGKKGLSGKFKWNNRPCKWSEGFDKLNRILNIHCKKQDNAVGEFCQYKGNPHVKSCAWYNQNNQAKFYKCLVDVLIEEEERLCNPNTVVCNKCPKVVFGQITYVPQRRRPASEKNIDTSYDQGSEGHVDDYYIDNY